jgi:hypothetical protein
MPGWLQSEQVAGFGRNRWLASSESAGGRASTRARVHGISENHRFIGLDPVHQGLVALDESRLFRRVELARNCLGLAVFHVQAMQQRDQSRPSLVFDAAFTRDPSAHFAGGAGQGRSNPDLQFVLLFGCQPAGAALMAEVCQTFDAVFLILPVPRPDRVVVDEQHFGCRLAGHAVIQKQNRVGPTSQTVRRRPISSQVDQILTRFRVEEASTDHKTD